MEYLKQNTAIISIERYDELKNFERVVLDDSETLFYVSWDGALRERCVYYSSEAHYEIVEMNNSLKIEIEELKKNNKLKEMEIKELKKRKRKLFKWF